ncbi:hypothetical protein OG21DRAFT_852485 [Imleria badia]|nr:hypothetical protein OG21DRAFT_852485 [Imleria badia]
MGGHGAYDRAAGCDRRSQSISKEVNGKKASLFGQRVGSHGHVQKVFSSQIPGTVSMSFLQGHFVHVWLQWLSLHVDINYITLPKEDHWKFRSRLVATGQRDGASHRERSNSCRIFYSTFYLHLCQTIQDVSARFTIKDSACLLPISQQVRKGS